MGTGSPRKPLQIPNPTQAGELTPDPLPCPHFQAAGRRPPWFPVLKVIQNKDTFFRSVLKTSPSGLWAFFSPPSSLLWEHQSSSPGCEQGGFSSQPGTCGVTAFPQHMPSVVGKRRIPQLQVGSAAPGIHLDAANNTQNASNRSTTCKPTGRNLRVFLHPSEVPKAAVHHSSPQQRLKKPLLPSPRVLFLTWMISVIPFTAPQLEHGRGAAPWVRGQE